jgi:hypothetical protein
MYDGTDVALVLGGLLSASLAGLFLTLALVMLGIVVHKSRSGIATASRSGRLAAFFGAAAILCGLSIPSGLAMYFVFEHQRGHANPPAYVIAVAVASVWGPAVVGMFGCYRLLRGTRGRPREFGRAEPGASADRPRE